MNATTLTPHSGLWLAETPHRALFAVGGGNLLLAMAVWAVWLLNLRFGWMALPEAPLYPGLVHALILPYLVLGPFIFGFLLTVFPRWMAVPVFTRWHYLPIGLCLLSAQVLALIGMWGLPLLHHLSMLLGCAGWTAGSVLLLDRLRQDRSCCWHARSAALAVSLGAVGMGLLLLHQLRPDLGSLAVAVKLGVFGVLLPVYLTVAHRMFPFFAQCVLPGYAMWRPLWLLAALWPLLLGHAALELLRGYAWLWIVDLPLTVLGALMVWQWWPRQAAPPILRALFVGLCWLPLGFALYTVQSLLLQTMELSVLGRAPLHALTIGLFGSVLVAMVSRVSKGHSGRELRFSAIDRFAFVAIQAVAALRIAAEWASDGLLWNGIAAAAWVAVLLPWVVHCWRIWGSPRVDGKPG